MQHLKQLVWKSCYGSLSVSRKVFAHFNLRKYLAQALVLSKINYCESCILIFTLPDFLLKHLQRLQFAAATFTRGRYVRDFSLLKLVHKVLYMNNWPLALRSNQVTSLCTLRSSSASRLSNPHRSSGTFCPVKYPALTLFQILTAMLKHIFLTDKRLICRVFICRVFIFCRVFIYFVEYLFRLLYYLLYYFISFFFYLYLLVNFYHKSYPFLVFLTYWLTPFQILTAMLKHIFLTDKRLICRVFICRVFIFCRVFIYFCRVFISFIILFIVLFYFIFFYLLLACKFLSQMLSIFSLLNLLKSAFDHAPWKIGLYKS